MKRALVLAALPMLAVLAGCIGDGDDGGQSTGLSACATPLDIEDIQIVETTHDPLAGMNRSNAFLTETTSKRTCSLPAIGWTPLRWAGDEPAPHRYVGEIDLRGDLNLGAVAVLGSGEAPIVYLLDITDRGAPEVIASIPQTATRIVDVKISDDGALLFTASQGVPQPGELAEVADREAFSGFSVYDISSPASPRFLNSFTDSLDGCHMLSHEIINGNDAVFCVGQHVRAHLLLRQGGTVVSGGFFDYIPEENGLPLPSLPSTGVAIPQPAGGAVNQVPSSSGPHDMTVQVDEVTGQTLMFVSHWDAGVRVVDVSDPPNAAELGAWNGEGATHYEGNVHTAMMFYVGADRYVVATPELTSLESGVPGIWVLDANDYSDLKLVAQWYHPGLHPSLGLFLTTHQWQVAPTGADVVPEDVRIYLTMNHGGIWVLDFGQILAGDNQGAILGFNSARREIPTELAESFPNAALNTWDVNVVDGYIYGSDRATGLWVFHYQEDTLGNPRLTGFA